MPGPAVHQGAVVLCMHAGQAQPTAPNPRVLLGGLPAATLAAPYVVAGCTLPPPPAANGPCVTAQWIVGSTRVLAAGAPLVIQGGVAVCAPTGTGLLVAASQVRVVVT